MTEDQCNNTEPIGPRNLAAGVAETTAGTSTATAAPENNADVGNDALNCGEKADGMSDDETESFGDWGAWDVYGVGVQGISEQATDVMDTMDEEDDEVQVVEVVQVPLPRMRRVRNYYRNPRRSLRVKYQHQRKSPRLEAAMKKIIK